MGWLTDFAYSLQRSDPAKQRGKQLPTQSSKYDLIMPVWAPHNELKFVEQAYKANPVVYRSIEYLAQSVSTATMLAWREMRDGEEKLSTRHPISVLLRRPSRDYDTQTRFLRQVIRKLCLAGEAIIYKITEDSGRITELQLLDSAAITVIPASYGVDHYDYRPNLTGEPFRIDPEDVIFLKYDDPIDRYRGLSPLAAAWREAQTDTSLGDWRKAFFDNAAIPSGVLTTKMDANRERLKEWSSDWADKYSGYRNAGKTPALAGGLEYQKTGATPGEVDFSDVVAVPEIRIPMVFGVGPILINAKAGLDRSSYTNYESARVTFWQDTATPIMELLQDDFTVGLTRDTDPYFIRFDTSKVPALQEDAMKIEERAVSALRNGACTINEYREAVGMNRVEDGDVYLQPSNSIRIQLGSMDAAADPEQEQKDKLALEEKKLDAAADKSDDNENPNLDPNEKKPAAVGAGRSFEDGLLQLSPACKEIARALLGAYKDSRLASPLGDASGEIAASRTAGLVRKGVARFGKESGFSGDALLDFIDDESLRLGHEMVEAREIDADWIYMQIDKLHTNVGRMHVG